MTSWRHVRGPKFENLFFSCSRIHFRNCHTNSKDNNYFFTVLFQIEIAVGTLCPPPKANRFKVQSHKPWIVDLSFLLWHNCFQGCFYMDPNKVMVSNSLSQILLDPQYIKTCRCDLFYYFAIPMFSKSCEILQILHESLNLYLLINQQDYTITMP